MEPGSMENLPVVYRSRDFLVVNKHWDVRIDSKAWRDTPTLQAQLRHHFPELADPDTYYGFRYTEPGRRALCGAAAALSQPPVTLCSCQVLPSAGLLHERGALRGPEQGSCRQRLQVLQGATCHQGLPRSGKAWPTVPKEEGLSAWGGLGVRLASQQRQVSSTGSPARQVRGHVQESRTTISYAIGKSSAEGRAHTMCIASTQGMGTGASSGGREGGLGPQDCPATPHSLPSPPGCENPKPSLTELVVLEHGLYSGDPVSKVLLQPLTGVSRGWARKLPRSPQGHPTPGMVNVWGQSLLTQGTVVSLLCRRGCQDRVAE